MENKVKSILKNFNIDENIFSDILGSVILADKTFGNNRQEADIDRFASQFSTFGYNIEKSGIPPLPRVQVKRIFIDSLAIAISNKTDLPEGIHLTMPSSSHIKIGKVQGVSDYCNEAECDKIFDLFEAESSDDNCTEVFEMISNYLGELSKSKYSYFFKNFDFSKVYLPVKYNSYGFSVSTQITNDLKGLGDIEKPKQFENNFAVQVSSALIRGIYQEDSKDSIIKKVRYLKALSYLYDINKKNITIGVDTSSSRLSTVWMPKIPNANELALFRKVFILDKKATREDVDKIISVLNIL